MMGGNQTKPHKNRKGKYGQDTDVYKVTRSGHRYGVWETPRSVYENLPDRSHSSRHVQEAPKTAECDNTALTTEEKVKKMMTKYTKSVESPPKEMCSICMCNLHETSGFDEDDSNQGASEPALAGVNHDVVELSLCSHPFHTSCVRMMIQSSPEFLECPNCKVVHGIRIGNQPPGNMSVKSLPDGLPGYENCGTLMITYSFSSGVQGPEHPAPGTPYHAFAFPRVAFLPDNEEGNKVLRLLREAWRRRLLFTVGTSVTTGMNNVITWNEIHHKTQWHNPHGHGYPDPHYLGKVTMELALQGVTEESLANQS